MHTIDPARIGRPLGDEHPLQLDRYELLRVLGVGGMGTVFLAKQTNLDRFVAVKLLGGARGVRRDWRARFNLEIDALARLHHPNIVNILDRGDDDGRLFYVMEYVDGVNLRRFVRSRQTLQSVMRITYKIALALRAVHRAGLVHRDLKPENVLIDRHGEVKLTDFGIVKAVRDAEDEPELRVDEWVYEDPDEPGGVLTRAGGAIGTAAYMAPEQLARDEDVGPPADVYALGVVLHELLVGVRPEPDIPHVAELIPGLPGWLDTGLDLMLHLDPKRRLPSGEEAVKYFRLHAGRARGRFPAVGYVEGLTRKPVKAGGHIDGATDRDVDPAAATVPGGGATLGEVGDDGPAPDLGAALRGGKGAGRGIARMPRGAAVESGSGPVDLDDEDAPDDDDDSLLLLALDEEDEELPVAQVSNRGPTWGVRACAACAGTGRRRPLGLLAERDCAVCEGRGRTYRTLSDLALSRLLHWGANAALAAGIIGAVAAAGLLLFEGGSLPVLGSSPIPPLVVAMALAFFLTRLRITDGAQHAWRKLDVIPRDGVIDPLPAVLRRAAVPVGAGAAAVLALGLGASVLVASLLPAGAESPEAGAPAANGTDTGSPGRNGTDADRDEPPDAEPVGPAALPDGFSAGSPGPRGNIVYAGERFGRPIELMFVPERAVQIADNARFVIAAHFVQRHEVTAGQYAAYLNGAGIGMTAIDGVRVAKDGQERLLAVDVASALETRRGPLVGRLGPGWTAETMPDVRGGVTWDADAGEWRAAPGGADAPMLFVSWFGAQAFAAAAGGRLPSEAEWIAAARGPADGPGGDRAYPWGEWSGVGDCNTLSRWVGEPVPTDADAARRLADPAIRSRVRALNVTTLRGDVSPWGVFGLAGNVAEWTGDRFQRNLAARLQRASEPIRSDALNAPRLAHDPVAVHGAAYDDADEHARISGRREFPATYASWRIGFRCVFDVPRPGAR
jgi:formylglycine-generating enzyme required for sulfatase activity/predicted Ser/Thr protein kinase